MPNFNLSMLQTGDIVKYRANSPSTDAPRYRIVIDNVLYSPDRCSSLDKYNDDFTRASGTTALDIVDVYRGYLDIASDVNGDFANPDVLAKLDHIYTEPVLTASTAAPTANADKDDKIQKALALAVDALGALAILLVTK